MSVDDILGMSIHSPDLSPLLPVVVNPSFSTGITDPFFQSLNYKNCFRAIYFICNGHWPSRDQIAIESRFLGIGFWKTV